MASTASKQSPLARDTLFDAEAWYARDYVFGRLTLPSRQEMADDIDSWRARQDTLADPATR